ncbi:hypothetical protein SLE2022_002640 [Rubroshorea leprosula]
MMKQLLLTTFPSLLLFLLIHSSQTLAQAPAPALALPPAPSGPTNVTRILEKGGQFSIFIRLLKATREDSNLNIQLNNSNNEMTIFAPSDNAFSSLKSGTLNGLTDEDKSELVQFHVISSYLTSTQFQTVSNPLRTEAGSAEPYNFPLNVTTTGSSVNISTGLTNTSVAGTVYTDGQLAVYQVDQVLLPEKIFGPKAPPAPAPAPTKPKKKSSIAAPVSNTEKSSGTAVNFAMQNVVFLGVMMIAMVAKFSSRQ